MITCKPQGSVTQGRDLFTPRCTLSRTLDHGAVLLAVAPRLIRLTLNDFEGISPSAVSKLVQLLQHLKHLKHLSLDGPPEASNALVFTVRLASTLTCQDCPSQNLPKDTQPHCRSLQCKGIVSFRNVAVDLHQVFCDWPATLPQIKYNICVRRA